MPDPAPTDSSPQRHARLLKGAAVLAAVLGLFIVVWLVDKAVRYPEVRASQLGSVAPLWVPFAVFVALCVTLIVGLFWRAARRVEAGEDLFSQRHRRRSDEEDDRSRSEEPPSRSGV
jgi:type VI protein secretion system component VasK